MHKAIIGAALISWAPILVKFIDLGASWVAFLRVAISVVILSPFMIKTFKHLNKKILLWQAFAGVALGFDLAIWHESIGMIGAGLATLLANFQVFLMALFGWLIFKEKLGVRFIFSIFIAFLGIAMMVVMNGDFEQSKEFYLGVSYGFIAAFLYTTFLLSLRYVQVEFKSLKSIDHLYWIYIFCSGTLLVLSWVQAEMQMPSAADWLYLLMLGVVVQILAWYLIAGSISKIPTRVAGLVLLVQPVAALLLGYLIFNEVLADIQVFGVGLTLLGIYLGTSNKNRAKGTLIKS